MQGKKRYQPKLFNNFNLAERVPEDNFYRRLKSVLDLHFLYKETEKYYGTCGQKSIDPVVFFKLCLVGYLENIISDRQLIQHASMRLDILYFIDHDIDDELPWHSTISRTRDLFPDTLFEQLFEKVLNMCVEKGMVSGKTQAIDSAPVKANASMESLELKVPEDELEEHLRKVRAMSKVDKQPKENKASRDQRKLKATDKELKEIERRNENWNRKQDNRPGAKSKGAKYTSNKTHYSPTDPDARISVKPGKARKLNYHAQMSVDTAHHVITSMEADYADKHDSRSLIGIVDKLQRRLRRYELEMENVLADAGYSSGENYADMEQRGLSAYIPPHGTYKGGPDGFTYHKDADYWLCPQGKQLTFHKITEEKTNLKRIYRTKRADCRGCPIASICIRKSWEKRITITHYMDEYERAISRLNGRKGQYLKTKRQATIEPVFGVLTQYLAMGKVTTKGIHNANKQFMMAAIAYNLKKYLKFESKTVRTQFGEASDVITSFIQSLNLFLSSLIGPLPPFHTQKMVE